MGTNMLPPEGKAYVYNLMGPESGRHLRQIAIPGVSVDERLVRCPFLVIGASRDNTIPSKIVRKIALKYNAPFREYPDHGHMIILEPNWLDVARDTAAWLEKYGF